MSLRFDAGGKAIARFAAGRTPAATGIAAGTDGDVYVATSTQVKRFRDDGTATTLVEERPGHWVRRPTAASATDQAKEER